MVATPLTPTTRYFAPGTRKVYWLAACSNYLSPTRGELNAGTDLTAEISSLTGWSRQGATMDVPDLGTTFTAQIPARITSGPNDITFYLSANSNDARSLLPSTTNGFMVLLWEGDTTGLKMDIFPVRVMSQAVDSTVDAAGTVDISFAATKVPAISVAIP